MYELKSAPERLVLRAPDGRGPVLIHHLTGYMDAGNAGVLATEHLLASDDGLLIATFDADALVDHRARRPTMVFDGDRFEDYEPHAIELHLLHDLDDNPYLLLTGPEPDWQWNRFSGAVRHLVERLGVRLTVGLHGIPMGVPHTRPTGATLHATRPELLAGHQPMEERLEVPASVDNLIEYSLGRSGHDAAGVAVHVPHYLARSEYPTAAVSALEHVSRLSGLRLPVGELRACEEKAREEIEEQVAESGQVQEVVAALEEQYDAFERGAARGNLLLDGTDELPTGDELAAEFEQFLAERESGTGGE
ncbi:proteasome protein [Mangrovactinospora gilvigrisea]|uniref:Proteasome protein n=1 Tax=Mangrovactinospora gilvigrisea TaxID=1428644 RepID=A0A1J7BGW3_9ACTN|nr:proteasome protein [Mangrovactinospora gilvigrisea]